MDGKGLPRSTHHSPSYDTVPQPSANRRHRKPKPKQNALCDNNGRSHGPPPPHHHDQNHTYPLFNNRSLTMISTMHHLNPHRKVAMSPEILREAEEQASTLKKAVKQLQDQLDQANREKARIHRFLSDLLYTLNARGYESVQDHEGTLIDLNKCKGEAYLDLQGRDLKQQRGNVRRQSGQEFLLKAVIGNQERAIQTLVYKLDSIGRDMVLGNRLCIDDTPGSPRTHDNAKVSSLEAEVFQLVNLIEGACQNCPEIYPALRDHYYLQDEGAAAADRSPRNPVLHNLLKKCEQISAEARTKQLVDKLLTSVLNDEKLRPKSRQSGCSTSSNSSRSSSKASKTRSESKSKSSSHSKAPRAVSSDTSSVASGQSNTSEMYCPPLSPPPRSADARGYDDHLKPLNGGSKSESSFKQKGHRVTRSQAQTQNGTVPVCHKSGGEPTMSMPGAYGGGKYGADQSLHHECSVSVTICPYCHRKFGIEESIAEIKNHIEMHIYAGDRVV